MYSIKYHKKAIKQLKKLPRYEREKIAKKIHQLKYVTEQKLLNIKQFTKTEKSFRLRVGKIRIIYQVDRERKLILIRKAGYRGDIYKH